MDRNMIDYYPRVLQLVQEVIGMSDGQQEGFDQLWDNLGTAMGDQFLSTATEYGIARWEGILGISPRGGDTLEDRRFRVKARVNEQLPYTMRVLEQKLVTLCGEDGYSITLNHGAYTLTVKVALSAKSNFDDVDDLVRRIAPANLVIIVELKYNQYETLSKFTHRQLANYAHDQLRNEVLV